MPEPIPRFDAQGHPTVRTAPARGVGGSSTEQTQEEHQVAQQAMPAAEARLWIDATPLEQSRVTPEVVVRAHELFAIPERGDRLIAATAAVLGYPLITRDPEIVAAIGGDPRTPAKIEGRLPLVMPAPKW